MKMNEPKDESGSAFAGLFLALMKYRAHSAGAKLMQEAHESLACLPAAAEMDGTRLRKSIMLLVTLKGLFKMLQFTDADLNFMQGYIDGYVAQADGRGLDGNALLETAAVLAQTVIANPYKGTAALVELFS